MVNTAAVDADVRDVRRECQAGVQQANAVERVVLGARGLPLNILEVWPRSESPVARITSPLRRVSHMYPIGNYTGEPAKFLGRKIAVTWQTGEGAIIAARTGVPVVSDFRPADMAAGGKGAPLVPFLDYLLYRDPKIGRIVQNIGGIANLTAIPAGASSANVKAFDTGPGNMLIDAVTERLFNRPYDRDGRIAATGTST